MDHGRVSTFGQTIRTCPGLTSFVSLLSDIIVPVACCSVPVANVTCFIQFSTGSGKEVKIATDTPSISCSLIRLKLRYKQQMHFLFF